MSEANAKSIPAALKIRHRGRLAQIPIYLGKLFRSFIYQNDWKVLPMTAFIAALVSMVMRKDFFLTLEGSLKGAFALTCVAIWNGCFNSIQSVCRERGIVKREHRSGMHISSYVCAHMIYQALLCLAQTVLTLYVSNLCGVQFKESTLVGDQMVQTWRPGMFTPWVIVDLGITLFFASYASDMVSLFVSSITHTTTAAMTVMPFLLIFQVIFSGGLIPLPAWSRPLSNFTISNYTIRCVAAHSHYNEVPSVSVWNTLETLMNRNAGADVSVTVGQIADALSDTETEGMRQLREKELGGSMTVSQLRGMLEGIDAYKSLMASEVLQDFTVRDALNWVLESPSAEKIRSIPLISGLDGFRTVGELMQTLTSISDLPLLDQKLTSTMTLQELLTNLKIFKLLDSLGDRELTAKITVGQLLDLLTQNEWVRANRDMELKTTIRLTDIVDTIGRDRVKEFVSRKTAEAAHKDEYALTVPNITKNWLYINCFTGIFALLSVIALEFIDRDKR